MNQTRLAQPPTLPRRRKSRLAQPSSSRSNPRLSQSQGIFLLGKRRLSCQHRMIPISDRTHRQSQRLSNALKMSACPFLFLSNPALTSSVSKQQPQMVLRHRTNEITPSSWTLTETDQQVTHTLPKSMQKRRLQLKSKRVWVPGGKNRIRSRKTIPQ